MELHAGHFKVINLVAERNYNLEMFHGAAPLNSVIADVFGS